MKCPTCGEETPSVLDFCQKCRADLRSFHTLRSASLEGTGQGESVPGFRVESWLRTAVRRPVRKRDVRSPVPGLPEKVPVRPDHRHGVAARRGRDGAADLGPKKGG
jgi:hypothetical protein